ncbi:MAG: MarR family transcriptional regulator [Actinomycetota bacterium]|nr:MarR family transcriptional regulator [Actinomycetota bacterium]
MTAPDPSGERHDVARFRHVVLAAQRLGNRVLAEELRPLGLTPAWAEALTVLAAFEPLTIRELGRLLVCEADHPSRLAARLERDGLVARRRSTADRRAVELALTTSGRDLARRVTAIEDGLDRAIRRRVADADIEAVTATLLHLLDDRARDAIDHRYPSPSS